MKKKLRLIFFSFLLLSGMNLWAGSGVIRIVVLGSSTAAGAGPQNSANAWVNQYRQYVLAENASSQVINLAVGGYTTYHILPTGSAEVADRPSPDPAHNITKALSYSPDAIIINLPTNDAAKGYTVSEQLSNYDLVLAKASAQNIPVWVTTTQPRNLSLELRNNLMAMRDSTLKKFGDKAVDFWTDIATDEGMIKSIYDMGDGVHLNDAAHTILKDRVINTEVLTYARSDNEKDTICIDFGSSLSTGTWNNMNNAVQDTILNMKNTQNQGTGISIWIHDPFTGINTSGSSSPDASIGFPASASSDSFFGSVAPHGGISEPTGGITISGLNRNSLYSFAFFASRDGVTDNRETEYTVSGKTEQKVALDPANNTANVAVVTDISPAANGTILITVGPGANNSNSSQYYFLGAIRMTSIKQAVEYDTDGTINIDCGSTISSGNWNNLIMPTGGETLTDLVNSEGNSTGFSAWVHDSFTGVNVAGATNPDASLEMSADASSDSFFGSTGAHSGVVEATGGITLGGLNSNLRYTFSFFASRDGVNDNRETQYKVTGETEETVLLDAANNKSRVVTTSKIAPANDGTITIEASPGPENNNALKYYYLGVIRVEYGSDTGADNLLKEREDVVPLTIYPNPFREMVTIDCDLPDAGDLQVKIYSMDGKVVKVINNKKVLAEKCSVQWNRTDDRGKNVAPGLYLCRVSLLTDQKTYSSSRKLMVK